MDAHELTGHTIIARLDEAVAAGGGDLDHRTYGLGLHGWARLLADEAISAEVNGEELVELTRAQAWHLSRLLSALPYGAGIRA